MSFMNARAQGLFKATDFMKSKSLFFEKLKIERQGGGKYTTIFEQYIDYYVNNFLLSTYVIWLAWTSPFIWWIPIKWISWMSGTYAWV